MPGLLTRFLTTSAARVPMPRWGRILFGSFCVVAGAVLALRPFTSLGALVALVAVAALVTGLADIFSSDYAAAPGPQRLLGGLWIVSAVAIAAWPGLAVAALALWVGVMLVLAGVVRVVSGILGTTDQRLAAVVAGLASVVFGVLALSWPDVTLLVVAVVFGARTLLFGLSLIVDDLHHRESDGDDDGIDDRRAAEAHRPWWRRFVRTLGASVALVVALALGGVSVALHKGKPGPDAFYTTPANVPVYAGALLRTQPFTRAVPAGAHAWRILYTTTDSGGAAAAASALVVVSDQAPATPRPVVAWAHGTTGVARPCAPSLLKDPFTSGALPGLDQVLDQGWVLVATDYTGLGTPGPHPYLIGPGQAHSVLDAVRAARHVAGLRLSGQTVVWGHSQGGNAALWTGQLAPTYAPDVPLAGVAALAPASDLPGLVKNLGRVPGGAIFASYVIAAYSAIYPDVSFDAYIRPTARALVRGYASRCLAEPEVFVSVASSLILDRPIYAGDPTAGPLRTRLVENSPLAPIATPLFVAQGLSDPLVLPAVQQSYVQRRCHLPGHGPLDYRTYAGRDHVGVVAPGSPMVSDLVRWTADRFAGKTAPTTC